MGWKQILIVPNRNCLEDSYELAQKYQCGFEYQDFFVPSLLDEKEECEEALANYEQKKPDFSVFHGVFLDIAIFSEDSRMRAVSDERVEQSLQQAARLGVKAVVFHTNYIANFLLDTYRENWIEKNESYWKQKLEKYPMLQIYIENMFDDSPELIARLGERMKEEERFGICFDYAHAHVFGDENRIAEWVTRLAPYVKYIHINDNDFVTDLHLPIGTGKIDWQCFKQYYEQYFSDCPVLIEVNGTAQTEQSLQYLLNL